jgi:mono/diheme cytochrome c family protein
MRFVRLSMASLLIAFAGSVAGQGAALADGDAQKGKVAFIRNGCWQCHDFNGEGSVATSNGKVIARTQLPLDAFISFVHTTNGAMPPFRPQVLSDADLTDIYAYLQSLPEPKQVKDIPLLNNNTRTQ